jgi:hypothetical protein
VVEAATTAGARSDLLKFGFATTLAEMALLLAPPEAPRAARERIQTRASSAASLVRSIFMAVLRGDGFRAQHERGRS